MRDDGFRKKIFSKKKPAHKSRLFSDHPEQVISLLRALSLL
jgi:hypothetical protein